MASRDRTAITVWAGLAVLGATIGALGFLDNSGLPPVEILGTVGSVITVVSLLALGYLLARKTDRDL